MTMTGCLQLDRFALLACPFLLCALAACKPVQTADMTASQSNNREDCASISCVGQLQPDALDTKNLYDLHSRLQRLHIKIENSLQYGVIKQETVFHAQYEPVKEVMVEDRETFRRTIERALLKSHLGSSRRNIISLFPVLHEQDFENTGKLLYQADFDVLLNNILTRAGLSPVTPEHFSAFMEDFEQGRL